MRDFKGMKRQRGRNRGGGQGQGGGGGGKPQHNINRAFDSQGPDNIRVRGNAQTVYEKYQGLARDATLAGDRVLAENHLQHAEHYFRTLRAIQPNRPASEIVSRDSLSSGYDIDFEDEAVETAMEEADAQAAARAVDAAARLQEPPGEGEAAAAPAAGGEAQPRFDRDRSDRGGERREWRDRPERTDRPPGEFRDRPDRFNDRSDRGGEFRADRQDRQNQGEPRQQGRQDRQGQDRQGQGGDFGDRPRFRDRDDRFRDRPERQGGDIRAEGGERPPREDRPSDREGRRDRFRERGERTGEERRPEARDEEVASAAFGAPEPALAPAPARREEPAPVLRSEDGGVSALPGFLQPPTPEGEVEPRRRPRRRRTREEGDAAPAGAASETEQA